MNQTLLNLTTIWTNTHVRWPVMLTIACEVGVIWLPKYAEQFKTTQKVLLFYGVAAAANSTPPQPKKANETKTSTPDCGSPSQ